MSWPRFTEQGLAQFEIVFFNNTSGDVFKAAEEQAYEKWMTLHDGAFAGVHYATDTENGWAFLLEVAASGGVDDVQVARAMDGEARFQGPG